MVINQIEQLKSDGGDYVIICTPYGGGTWFPYNQYETIEEAFDEALKALGDKENIGKITLLKIVHFNVKELSR
jgi:hypothetical protein